MSTRAAYRPRGAKAAELQALIALRERAIAASPRQHYRDDQIEQWRAQPGIREALGNLIERRLLWVTGDAGTPQAMAGLEPATGEMLALYVDPACRGAGLARRLVAHVERRAAAFGLASLRAEAALPALGLYRLLGYREVQTRSRCRGLPIPAVLVDKSIRRRRTRYQRRVLAALQQRGIDADYGQRHELTMQPPPPHLASIDTDCFGRPQWLAPRAARAWHRLQAAAQADDIELQAVSGYRSFDYQCAIVDRKMAAGHSIDEILQVSAAPGFSEHHSGCALDLTAPGCEPLTTRFAETAAYRWLCEHAAGYGFELSYPRDNRHGIAWEPWHWRLLAA